MISYTAQNTTMPDIQKTEVSDWLKQVAASYGKVVGDICYIFVDDETILDVNRRFLGHDYYTDHIGFDYSHDNAIGGDIYISLDTVRTNAELYDATFRQELHRIIVHGLLHLCGLRDKTDEEEEQMHRAEDAALERLTTHIH
ncbi:MAG: rRNA maturation RNase YbeY [Bacteroidaceae bacterium]|nr:rRNA maturation RNase YbeY [Bacteroidaceae bacterium]